MLDILVCLHNMFVFHFANKIPQVHLHEALHPIQSQAILNHLVKLHPILVLTVAGLYPPSVQHIFRFVDVWRYMIKVLSTHYQDEYILLD